VKLAFTAGNALHDQACIFSDENAHVTSTGLTGLVISALWCSS
jgi:hypothetical protein